MLWLLVDVTVKSLLLAIVAWSALTAFRVRNPNVRHRAWSAVLLGMMTLPFLVPVTPTVPIPSWLVPDFASEVPEPPQLTERNESVGLPPVVAIESDISTIMREDLSLDHVEPELPQPASAVPPAVATAESETSTTVARATNGALLLAWLKQHGYVTILAGYLCVVAGLLFRILAGIWGTQCIVARAVAACISTSTTNPIQGDQAEARSRYPILVSHEIRVPLTVGFLRPKILLPTDWRHWDVSKLQAVLAHETAHIQRGDFLVTLLAEFNRAVYWFNPLAWFLRRHLADLAEQNCDDAVIASTGDRTLYARHLLEVAASLSDQKHRVAWSGVAMARRPNVASRIDAILDAQRPLSRGLGIAGALLLIATTVPAVLFTAALRPEEANAQDGVTTKPVETTDPAAANVEVALVSEPEPIGNVANANEPRQPTRIHGQVVNSDGRGVQAQVHVVSAFLNGMVKPGREQVLTSIDTDAQGNFDVMFNLPARRDRIDLGQGPGTRVEQIVAVAKGYGPAVRDVIDIRRGKPATLKLRKDDVPIEGTILNLEGEPVQGASLRVAMLGSRDEDQLEKQLNDLRVQSGEKPDEVAFNFIVMNAFDDHEDLPFMNERMAANKLSYSNLVPTAVTTDANGRFRIDGIGRDRLLVLELSGPGIVTSWISVVSAGIEPIGKSAYTANRTDVTYGARFTFTAEPDQVIEGAVTDSETGKPIAGITIEPSSQTGLVSAVTDESGRYRLTGLPKSKHYFSLRVPNDLPYFSRRYIEVDKSTDGLKPTKLDFQLKQTTWVAGTVRDKVTGQPVRARVLFTPHLESEVATAYSLGQGEYIDPMRMAFGSDTDEAGRFRVKAIPDDGLLAVVCQDRGYCTMYSTHDLDEKWLTSEAPGRPAETKTYHRILPGWTHGLKVISAVADKIASSDVLVDPGNTMQVSLVDTDNKPVANVHVRNRFPFSWNSEPPAKASIVKLLAIDPNTPRTVLFYQRERNLGAYLLADQTARHDKRTLVLELCGVVKGRLVSENGEPLAGVPVGIKPLALVTQSYEATIPYAESDKNGYFVIERFTPSHAFAVLATAGEQEAIANSLEIKPGETRDLGTVTLKQTRSRSQAFGFNAVPSNQAPADEAATAKREPESADSEDLTVTVTGEFFAAPTDSAAAAGSAPSDAETPRRPLVFAGQVLLPTGQPAVGAKIYFNYWRNTAYRELEARPVAVTDAYGNFRCQRNAASIDMESFGAHLVATLDGYGFATALAQAFEKTGFFEQNRRNGDWAEQLMQHDRGPMRLLEDNAIIRGKIVDLEGTRIPHARVAVVHVLANAQNDASTWDDAIKNPQIDFITLDNSFPRQLRGPEVASIFRPVVTGNDGTFKIRGLGKHRIAKLAVTGKNLEASTFFARSDGGNTLKVPLQAGSLGMPSREFTYYANEFTHVVSSSRPVVGRVTDAETGEPVEAAIINSTRMWSTTFDGTKPIMTRSGSDVAWAVTDANGRYRLDGLPRAKTSFVRVVGGSDYLPEQSQADTSGNKLDAVTVNFKLRRGMVLEGRITEATTGKGIQATIEFFPKGNQTRFITMGSERPKISDSRGRFRIVVEKQDGHLCFTALPRHHYEKRPLPEARGGDGRPPSGVMVFRAMAEFHAIHEVDADQPPTTIQVQAKLASVIAGHAVGPDGNRVRDLQYVGQAQGQPFWSPSPLGDMKMYGVQPNETRMVAVICQKQKLAGFVELREAKDGFTVKLKPWATLKGQIVGEDGDALGNTRLVRSKVFGTSPYYYSSEMPIQDLKAFRASLPLPPVSIGRMTGNSHAADDQGQFEIAGLVPGYPYAITGIHQSSAFDTISSDIVTELKLRPGETRDLGEVILRKPTKEEIEAQTKPSPKPISFSTQPR